MIMYWSRNSIIICLVGTKHYRLDFGRYPKRNAVVINNEYGHDNIFIQKYRYDGRL